MTDDNSPDIRDVPAIVDAASGAAAVVKSASRVLRILEFFDEVQREARVAEIAARLEYPQSSTSVLLQSLVRLGYLDYDGASRSFLPTARVALLGTWLDAGPVRDGRLIRMMESLSQETGGTVILAARNGIHSHYVRVLQARTPIWFHVPQGSRRLLVWSGTGTALLTGAPDAEIRALVLRTNAEALSGQAMIDARQALAHVKRARLEGYFFSRALVTAGAGSIAVPLPGGIDRRDRPLCIAVSGLLDDIARREEAVVAAVRKAIQRCLIEP